MGSPLLCRYLGVAVVVDSPDHRTSPLVGVRSRMAGLLRVHRMEVEAEAEALVPSPPETEVGAEFSGDHLWNQGRWIVLH